MSQPSETSVPFGRRTPPSPPAVPAPTDSNVTGRRPFHLLAKPTGPISDLDCEYCFFLTKEALYPGDRFRMTDDVLVAHIGQLIDAQPDGEVIVAWQGGEPTLMGIDFFRRAVALVLHTIQTNGTLLTDEWVDSWPNTDSSSG
jgi:serine-type anaerobic sulfatase-maturating enzyme